MSYRLIDANAIVPSHPEVNDMPCIYADLSDGLDGRLYDLRESRRLQAENAKLRELVYDMLVDEERGHNDDGTFYEHVRLAKELGIEVG